jgi:hypothetical protein
VSDLLVHSMAEFGDIILPCLAAAHVRNIVEIGAEFGGMSQRLGEFVVAAGGVLTSIDPAPKPAFIEWSNGLAQSRHIASLSLDAIPTLADVDAWIIDGDHNYYTVLNELRSIDAVSCRDGKPLLAFLHDVGWPCGRRDFYYAPDQIPAAWCQPHDYDGGALLDTDRLVEGRGFRGHGNFAFAVQSGGPHNGIMTAVEDFIAEQAATGRDLAWAHVPAVFGLGVLFDVDAPWSETVAAQLMPFHENRLLASLERNRLLNYLKVIDYQDAHSG